MSRENIELCLSLCYFDLLEKNYIKGYTSLTSGKVIPKLEFVSKDIKNTDHSVETGGLYLFDFEYFDSYWLHEIFANQAFFVIPIQNISGLFKTMSQELEHIPYFDDTSEDFNSLLEYSGFLRIVRTNDSSDKNNSFYLTNFLDIPADEVTRLYRSRYQLKRIFFFLRKSIKNFMGTTPNAMRIQIYVLILIHVLMVLIKVKLNSKLTTSEIKNIVSRNLLSKESLHTLLIKVGQE